MSKGAAATKEAGLMPAGSPLLLVIRNFSSLTAAELASRVVMLAAVGFYARQLRPEMFGYLAISGAVVAYLSLVAGFGVESFAAREIARAPHLTARYAGAVLSIRLLFSAVTYAGLAAVLCFVAVPPPLKRLMWVDGLDLFPLAITTGWAFQGLQKMGVVAVARVVQSCVTTVLVIALVRGPQGAQFVVWSNLLGACAASALMLFLLGRALGHFRFTFGWTFARDLVRRSLPFALMAVAGQLYCQSGFVLLGWWRPAAEAGLFGSAYRLTYGVLQSFAGLLLMAFLPALSRTWAAYPEQLRLLHRSYARFSNLCAAGIVGVFCFFPGPVLRFCFGGDYAGAAPVLRLLAGCMAFSFISGPYVAGLMATRFEHLLLRQTVGFALLCVVLSLLLIPSYGGTGAAAALLVSIAAGTLSSMYYYHRCLGRWAQPWTTQVRIAGSTIAAPTQIF